MKIFTNGARHWGGQIDRIDAGFRQLGHELTPHAAEADLVYSNNDHKQIVADKLGGRLKSGAKVILTVLDVPEHLFPYFDLRVLELELSAADAICTISRFGREQVLGYLNRDSHVIYQPIKPVKRQPRHAALQHAPAWRFMHCGRRSDSNKRFALGATAIQLLGYTDRDFLLIGNEPGWGDYRGVLDDRGLEVAYNRVDFVMCTSRVEGLCLPVLEAMAAGAVPVVCNDMTTRRELLPEDLFPEYAAVGPTPQSIARFLAYYLNDESGLRLSNLKGRLHDHYNKHWAAKVSPVGVAGRILEVYNSLT